MVSFPPPRFANLGRRWKRRPRLADGVIRDQWSSGQSSFHRGKPGGDERSVYSLSKEVTSRILAVSLRKMATLAFPIAKIIHLRALSDPTGRVQLDFDASHMRFLPVTTRSG